MTKQVEKKNSHAKLTAFLVLIMLVELAIIAWKYPGFLNEDENSGKSLKEMAELKATLHEPLPELSPKELRQTLYKPTAGISGLAFGSIKNIKPEKTSVSTASPKAEFGNGLSVKFCDKCLGEEPRELSVRSLGNLKSDAYGAVGYDLLLDNKEAEFDDLVEVTLPYDKSWGENVFVQYFNNDSQSWEIRYAEPDGQGHVTFQTDHFCTYAVFRNMVEKGENLGNAKDDVISISDPYKDGKRVYVTVNWGTLAARIRKGEIASDKKLNSVLNKKFDQYEEDLNKNGNFIDNVDFLTKITGAPETMSGVIGGIGVGLSMASFLHQANKNGWEKAIKENWDSLGMTALGMLCEEPICITIQMIYFVVKKTDATYKEIVLGGASTAAEYAYRIFTTNHIAYNERSGAVRPYYFSSIADPHGGLGYIRSGNVPSSLKKGDWLDWVQESDRSEVKPLQRGEFILKSGSSDVKNANWKTVINNAIERQKRGKGDATYYVQSVIHNYARAFWGVRGEMLGRFLSETNDFPGTWWKAKLDGGPLVKVYKEPDSSAKREYSEKLEGELYGWLKNYLKELDLFNEAEFKKSQNDFMNKIYSKFVSFEDIMNKKFIITVIDEISDDRSFAAYSAHPMGLATSPNSKPTMWLTSFFGKDKVVTDEFTGYAYAKAGNPTYLVILDKEDGHVIRSEKFELDKSNTKIVLENDEMTWVRDQEVFITHTEGSFLDTRIETTRSINGSVFKIHEKRYKQELAADDPFNITLVDEKGKVIKSKDNEESESKMSLPWTMTSSFKSFFETNLKGSTSIYIYYEQSRGVGPIAYFTAHDYNSELIPKYFPAEIPDNVVYLVLNGDVGLRYRYMKESKAKGLTPVHVEKHPLKFGNDGDYILDKSKNFEPDPDQPVYPDIPQPKAQDTNQPEPPKPSQPTSDSGKDEPVPVSDPPTTNKQKTLRGIYDSNPSLREQFRTFEEFEKAINGDEQDSNTPSSDNPNSLKDTIKGQFKSQEELDEWLNNPPED